MNNIFQQQVQFWAHMLDECFDKCSVNETDWSNASKNYVARRDKNDEWYTPAANAQKIIEPFKKHLRGKSVYCNCDDPDSSDVFKFLLSKFKEWGLKRLVSTGWHAKHKAVVDAESLENGNWLQDSPGDGGMESEDSLDEAQHADVIVSNPPFSSSTGDVNKFKKWVSIALSRGCGLIGIGPTIAINQREIASSVLDRKLFVYPCERYKFGRAGDNLVNNQGKLKQNVQVSTFSTYDVDIPRQPVKFNEKVFLEDLPTAKWRGEDVPVTYNEHGGYDQKGQKAIQLDAFSSLLIPPPTQANIGKLVIVPFSIIDMDWMQHFSLEDIINRIDVQLSNGVKVSKTSGLVLKYAKAGDYSQERSGLRSLTQDNIEQFIARGKREIDKVASQDDENETQLKKLKARLNFNRNSKEISELRRQYWRALYDYAKSISDHSPVPSDFRSIVNKATSAYYDKRYDDSKKKEWFSRLLKKLKAIRFYNAHPDKNTNNYSTDISDEELDIARSLIMMLQECMRFNEKYDKLKTTYKTGTREQAIRAVTDVVTIAEQSIIPEFEKLSTIVPKNLVDEITYKVQVLKDKIAKAEDDSYFQTYQRHCNRFKKLMGMSPENFDLDVAYENVRKKSIEQLKSDYKAIESLRAAVGMYAKYIRDYGLKPDVRQKIQDNVSNLQKMISTSKSLHKKRIHELEKNSSDYSI